MIISRYLANIFGDILTIIIIIAKIVHFYARNNDDC